ncbi:uncharacterized protein LOC123304953 isoform X2 [Chrysoperla carnea]|uniref:uncharacterized protein LOC123304953 isoform X2 n=1 Tax=Chrysoperla carnea TaxID=189513 RepID=UPI001D05D3DC|nr:uncharacterized protein LOC123304953 isoform X2 [Chrysoperla carnea]
MNIFYKMNWIVSILLVVTIVEAGDMMRKSIVFDKNTPDVFYCPIHKPTGFDKLIVKARPLSRLCEFEGKGIPEDYKSDCYQDVDETEYACKEKYRIMMRMYPPGSEKPFDDSSLAKFKAVDMDKVLKVLPEDKRIFLKNRLG